MLRFGYQPGLAAGVATAVGTLGALIPPSIMMVLYAVFAEVPVGKMLIAGVLPGLLTAACYAGLILIRCTLNPSLAPRLDTTQITTRYRLDRQSTRLNSSPQCASRIPSSACKQKKHMNQ